MALSRPAHQRVTRAVGRSPKFGGSSTEGSPHKIAISIGGTIEDRVYYETWQYLIIAKNRQSMQNRKRYYREVYLELQRVVASNRFIFTQVPIVFVVLCLLGVVPLLVYLMFWVVIVLLGMHFERPYRILRWLLPYGNWPPALEPSSVGRKVAVVIYIFLVIVSISIGMYLELQFLGFSIFDFCGGSVACSIIEAVTQK